ncbi:MAG: dienelactone hydrolase family protein [Gemmataceae bacterium]|nr:dienelactone hydrolase family protein [Gemmataceae bacterium]
MFRSVVAVGAVAVAAGVAPAGVKTEAVEYEADGVKLKGFVAYDDANKDKKPGVIVFPEWWGLNDYAKNRAKQLSEMGYVAFAADLYGGGKVIDTAHPEDAMKSVTTLRQNQEAWRARAAAALKQLTARPDVDAGRVAAVGYCFGGSTALQLAYTGADLKAVATFHAALPPARPEEAKAVKAKILVTTGGDDKGIPKTAIDAFTAALLMGGVKPEVVVYPGVVHSFTVPEADKVGNANMKYDKAADEDSWAKMKKLFQETLGK